MRIVLQRRPSVIPPEDSYLDETPEDRERESLAEVVCIEHDEVAICMICGTGRDL